MDEKIREINEMIEKIKEISDRTEIINKENTIQPSNREILKMDTKTLYELADKLKRTSVELNNERLKNIAEEIEILANNREIRDNQQYISKTSYYDEFTGTQKKNGNTTEREEQQANAILLKELSEELKKEQNIIHTNENQKKEEIEQLEQSLNNLEKKEKLEREISVLSSQLPTLFQVSIMKEIADNNLIPKTNANFEGISSLKELASMNAQEWKNLKSKLKNIEAIISSELLEQSKIVKLKTEVIEIQQQIQNCVKYASIYHKINEKINDLKELSEKIPKEITEEGIKSKIDAISKENEKEQQQRQERLLKAEKEEKYNIEFKKIENQIIESMKNVPEALQLELGIKLESAGLLTPNIDKILRSINDKQENNNIENVVEFQTKLAENTTSINNNLQRINEEQKKYNELIIREHTEGLSKEDSEYKEKLKNYIEKLKQDVSVKEQENKNGQRIIRYYNQTNKLIDQLINLTKQTEDEKEVSIEPSVQNTEQNQKEILGIEQKELPEVLTQQYKTNTEDLVMPEFLKDGDKEEKAELERINPKDVEILDNKGNKIEQSSTDEIAKSYEVPKEEDINIEPLSKSDIEDAEILDNKVNIIEQSSIDEMAKSYEVPKEEDINIEPLSKSDIEDAVNTFEEEPKKKGVINKIKHIIKSVRKPKDKDKIKKSLKWKIATLATKLVLIGAGLLALGNLSSKKNDELIKQANVNIVSEEDDNAVIDIFDESGEKIVDSIKLDDEKAPEIPIEYIDENNQNLNSEIPIKIFNENNKTDEIINSIPVENKEIQEFAEFVPTAKEQQPEMTNNETTEWDIMNPELVYLDNETNTESEESMLQKMLGSTVTIQEGAPIYTNAANAYYNENAKIPYFDNSEEREVVGIAFWNDNTGLKTVYSYHENKDEMIKNIIADGGKVMAVLTQMKEHSGEFKPDGWRQVKDIVMEQNLGRGMSK